MSHFTVTETQVQETMAAIGRYIQDELLPFEKAHGISWEGQPGKDLLQQVWQRSAALGFYGLMLPVEQGGAGFSAEQMCRVKTFVAGSGAVLAQHVLGELSGPPRVGYLFKVATPDQIERFLRPISDARMAVCFAMTEEQAGSDAAAIQARAVHGHDAQGEHYLLTGHKRFISGAPYADVAIVLAVTDPAAGARGISAFFVDMHDPGMQVVCDYVAMHGQASHADLHMQDLRVPAANRIGAEGEGFKLGIGRINFNRLLHCATIIGFAELALRLSVQRANQRTQFGKPIGQFQAIAHMLANMATELQAARAMTLDAARQLDAGAPLRMEASMCKLFVSEAAFRIADQAVQIHGGTGLIRGNPVEWLFRMLRMMRILTGTSEILRNTVAKELLESDRGA
ncbi:acyl-CoA dehydrogenase family protein [Acidovorax sp. FJL06]|uniref:acyl-CoA dehydrogenase family protein n=1 Tax=Acidovorax sp. FJL06 TaxID=2153365 RepID=UPI000F573C29|nr:acyl-CoA dehydrogenase family protein [Acidovorax sp. FJL06]RQO80601.1 acyl-CoA dehydrogenase [Acidovorax sp. FJL06]